MPDKTFVALDFAIFRVFDLFEGPSFSPSIAELLGARRLPSAFSEGKLRAEASSVELGAMGGTVEVEEGY
jgi:hypothetical protein